MLITALALLSKKNKKQKMKITTKQLYPTETFSIVHELSVEVY